MKKLLLSILLVLIGVLLIIFPNLVNYINEENTIFKFVKFFSDNPKIIYPVGAILIFVGLCACVIYFVINNKNKIANVIQKGLRDDYGDLNLSFPFENIIKHETIELENSLSTKYNSSDLKESEKARINEFVRKMSDKKRISYLGIAPMPCIVYLGYCLGESGKKISYYHWLRAKRKSVKLRKWGKRQKISCKEIIQEKSNECTICLSSSYDIDKGIVSKEFPNSNLIFLSTSNLGIDSVKNLADLDNIANYVRKTVVENSKDAKKINLLLSCSSELCFCIGTKLKTPAISNISIYNFCNKMETKWNWSLELTD